MQRVWEWKFASPPAAIWPSLADTARFNEAAALPKHEIIETPRPDGSVDFVGRLRKGPVTISWQERPVNWISEQWFEHCRDFRNGPFRSLCATFELTPDGGGSRGIYKLEAVPSGILGRLLLAGGFLEKAGRTFARMAAEADSFAQGQRPEPFAYDPPPVDGAIQGRVAQMVKTIDGTPNGHGLGQRLADYVLKAQEVDLWQVRPLKLAREWNDRPARGGGAMPAGGAGGVAASCAGTCSVPAAGWRNPPRHRWTKCPPAPIAPPATSTTTATSPGTSRRASARRLACATWCPASIACSGRCRRPTSGCTSPWRPAPRGR